MKRVEQSPKQKRRSTNGSDDKEGTNDNGDNDTDEGVHIQSYQETNTTMRTKKDRKLEDRKNVDDAKTRD